MEKSLRPLVAGKRPGLPSNGRAMTRPTAWSPTKTSRAIRQIRYNSSGGNDLFVRRYLKNGIGRGVDDQLAGPDMLFTQAGNNFRAGGGFVADYLVPGSATKFADQIIGKTVGVDGKGLVENDAEMLPMAGG